MSEPTTFPPILRLDIGMPAIPLDAWDDDMTEFVAQIAADAARERLQEGLAEYRTVQQHELAPGSWGAQARTELTELRERNAALSKRVTRLLAVIEEIVEHTT
jgi:hypothetical protein